MEKKLYSKPLLTAECFTPQQFVAACDTMIPSTQLGVTFWADLVDGRGYNYVIGKDNIIDNSNLEQFYNGHAPNGGTGFSGNQLKGHWFENMTLYRDLTGGHFNQGSDRYTNSSIMQPISGYENVAIYITKGAVAKVWIYRGEGGNKPSNPDWQNPSSTFKTMS